MKNDLLARYQVTKDFTAGYNVTNASRAAEAVRITLTLDQLNSILDFCLHKNLPVQQPPARAPSGAVFEKSRCPFGFAKGASGSWAEPYFACPTLCYGGDAYPPGILYRVSTGKRKENRIPGGILYNYGTKKLNDGRY